MKLSVIRLIVSVWVMWKLLGMKVIVGIIISNGSDELNVVISISVKIFDGIELSVLSVCDSVLLSEFFLIVVVKVSEVLMR